MKGDQESQRPLPADEALKLLGFPAEEYGDEALDECRYTLNALHEYGISESGLRGIKEEYDVEIPDALLTLHRAGVHVRNLFRWEFYAADFAGGTGSADVNALWSPSAGGAMVYWFDVENGSGDIISAFRCDENFVLTPKIVRGALDHCCNHWGYAGAVSNVINCVPELCGFDEFRDSMSRSQRHSKDENHPFDEEVFRKFYRVERDE
jgi:hypothetical protein